MILNSDSFWSNVATYKKTAKKSFMMWNLLHNIFTLDDFAYINGSIAGRGIILVSPWVSHERCVVMSTSLMSNNRSTAEGNKNRVS